MKNLILILLFCILLAVCKNSTAETNTDSKDSFNSKHFLDLAKATELLPNKLAYLRQAMVLNPLSKDVRKSIIETKQQISPNEAPLNLLQKESLIDYVSTKAFLPFYVEDYLMILTGAMALLFLVKKSSSKVLQTSIYILFLFFLSNKLFITYSRDGSLRTIKNFQDIIKTEGIALVKTNAFVSKDAKSDITFIVTEGNEVDFYSSDPSPGDWVKIGYENGRTGWVQYDQTKIYLIVR